MADDETIPGIETTLTDTTATATGVVAASPDEVFDYVRRPANHVAISGDGSVKGARVGPEVLGDGDRFGMRMKQFGLPYRITSKVSEFEDGRRIAWRHVMGHTWRWELEPVEGGTKLTETFDLSTCRLKPAVRAMGYPKGHVANVARSVANVRDHFAG